MSPINLSAVFVRSLFQNVGSKLLKTAHSVLFFPMPSVEDGMSVQNFM